MAEKKYYWLKLKKDFFNQREMKKLRRIAGGDTYTIIYLKMMLFSLDEKGLILYAETETDIYEQLSLELDEDVEDIKLTISFLLTNNLAELNKNDVFLSEVNELIGSESSSAKRVRDHRNKQKTLHCNTDVIKGNTEIEKEIELDIEKDKEINKEKNVFVDYFENSDINKLFNEFLENRVELFGKKTNTSRSIQMLVTKLNKYDDETKEQMINNSLENSWKGIFEIKQNNSKPKKTIGSTDNWNQVEEKELSEEEKQEMEDIVKKMKGDK